MKQQSKKKAAFLLTLAFCAAASISFTSCDLTNGGSSSAGKDPASTTESVTSVPDSTTPPSSATSAPNSTTEQTPSTSTSDQTTEEHHIEHVAAKDATCTEAGNGEYWICKDEGCGKIFSDEKGEYEWASIPVVKALGHDMQYSYDETGHWQTCSREDATTEKEEHSYVLDVSGDFKTAYNVGDTFNAEGMEVQELCECKYFKAVDPAQITYNTDPLTLADTSVEISVGDEKVAVAISVAAPTSLSVKLKEGVVYYANNKANPTAADFEVEAVFADGETKTLASSEYTVTPATGFALNGGEITVKCGTITASVNVELAQVAVSSIAVTKNPDKLSYTAGETFNPAGMEVTATYNDGSTRVVSENAAYNDDGTQVVGYTYTADALTVDDTSVQISYQGFTANVNITVAAGTVEVTLTSLQIADGLIVNAGGQLSENDVAVYGVYSNGNRELLSADQYTVVLPEGKAVLGDVYAVKAVYLANDSITATVNATVRTQLEGEDGTIVGGKANRQTEGIIKDGAVVDTGNYVSFAGGFANAVLNGNESSLTLSFVSTTDSYADITLRCGNGYLTVDSDGNYWMQALQVNTILDITLNGKAVTIGDDVILSGCGPATKNTSDTWALLYRVFYTFTIQNVALNVGVNEIKLTFKPSTEGATTCWNESPSSMNIDCLYIDTKGNVASEGEIQSIALSVGGMAYGVTQDELSFNVVATNTDGTHRLLDPSEYTVELTEGDVSKGYIGFGKYTFTATLKNNADFKTTSETELAEYKQSLVTKAYLLQDGDKVYYVLEFNNVGYEASDYVFFNKSTIYSVAKTESTARTMTFYFDVTDWTSADSIWPHLTVAGTNYVNGANANGDIRGNQLEFTNGETLTVNGKTYTISSQWSMPVLTITEG